MKIDRGFILICVKHILEICICGILLQIALSTIQLFSAGFTYSSQIWWLAALFYVYMSVVFTIKFYVICRSDFQLSVIRRVALIMFSILAQTCFFCILTYARSHLYASDK
jgi:hypothetical protein